MSSSERKWTRAQLYAINSKDGDLLLSAGAGSGKTATLTERVCRLVCEEGADISRILIVTFTKAAAKELKDRVRKRLEAKVAEDPTSNRFSRQIVALEGADISTISSFLLKCIRPYFSELGLPPSFSVADEAEIAVLRDRIMSDVVDDFFEEEKDSFISLADTLSSSKDEGSLVKLLLSLASSVSAKGFSPEVLSGWASSLEKYAEADFFESPHGAVIRGSSLDFLSHFVRETERMRSEIAKDEFVSGKYDESASVIIDDLNALKQAVLRGYAGAKCAIDDYKLPRLPTIKEEDKTELSEKFKGYKDDLSKAIREELKAKYSFSPEEVSEVQKETASLLYELSRVIGEFESRLSAEKKRRGVVDYEDIERFAMKLFVGADGKATDEARELAERYDYIFVDEYQDTNRVQDAVFSALAESAPRFMVGDIKQSIYSFRGAEPSVFTAYRNAYPTADPDGPSSEGEGRTLFMSDNFRSDPTVIDFVNMISEYMFPGTTTPFESGDRLIASKELGPDHTDHKVEIALISKKAPVSEAEDATVPDASKPEADYIAERVAKLLAEEKRSDGSPISKSDIMILVRSGASASDIEEALTLRGITAADLATEEFFAQKEILLALCILNAVDNPLRDIYLAGALKSPAFGFSVGDLMKLRIGKPGVPLWFCINEYDGADERLASKCERAKAFISKYGKASRSRDSASLILSIYDELSLWSLTDGSSPESRKSASIRENLTALYEMARNFESSSFGGLYGFISFLNKKMEKKSNKGAVDAGDAVSITTMHKSKGLEYPVCILACCSKQFNFEDLKSDILFDPSLGPAMRLRDATGLVKYSNPLREAVKLKKTYEQISEEMRILYVAMTRAKERLIITMSFPDAEETVGKYGETSASQDGFSLTKLKSFYQVILPASFLAMERGNVPLDLFTVRYGDVGFTKVSALTGKGEKEEEDLAPLFRERLSFVYPFSHLANIPAKITVSKLSPSLLDEGETTPEIELSKPRGRVPKQAVAPTLRLSDEESGGAERGTATHVFMQFCDFDALVTNGFDAELDRLLKHKFITKSMATLVDRRQIEKFVSSDFFGKIRTAANLRREFRFNVSLPAEEFTTDAELAEKLRASGADITVQGVVDVIFETADGEFILADYKTDSLSDYEKEHPSYAKQVLAERHRSQLTYYRRACEEIFKRKIDRVVIFSLALGDTADVK